MIEGYAHKRLDRLAWEIAIYDPVRKISYTLEFKEQKHENESLPIETTFVKHDSLSAELFKAFASALNQMGFVPDNATTAELKATKFHLEDMRKMAMTIAHWPNEGAPNGKG